MTGRRVGERQFSGGVGRLARIVGRLDWPLVVMVLLLCAIGLFNLYSATSRSPHAGKFYQQLVWIGLGTVGFVVLTLIDYRDLHRLAWIGVAGVVLMLIGVELFGPTIKGSQRWLMLGPVRVQPSELAKLAVILALARLLHDHNASRSRPFDMLPGALALCIPIALISLQPDLGSSLMVLFIAVSVVLMLVKHVWPWLATIAVSPALIPLLWVFLQPYQKNRILALIDPAADPTGIGWHTKQSIYAIGSGRITGKGYGEATQNYFDFLPEHWTDFPFSVWAEEWGFIGCAVLLILFGGLILACVNVATKAADMFGAAIALGVAAMLFWQMLVNIAMVLGLAPVVGVTLPLISYGGSSIMTVMFGLGLVSSVSMRRHGF